MLHSCCQGKGRMYNPNKLISIHIFTSPAYVFPIQIWILISTIKPKMRAMVGLVLPALAILNLLLAPVATAAVGNDCSAPFATTSPSCPSNATFGPSYCQDIGVWLPVFNQTLDPSLSGIGVCDCQPYNISCNTPFCVTGSFRPHTSHTKYHDNKNDHKNAYINANDDCDSYHDDYHLGNADDDSNDHRDSNYSGDNIVRLGMRFLSARQSPKSESSLQRLNLSAEKLPPQLKRRRRLRRQLSSSRHLVSTLPTFLFPSETPTTTLTISCVIESGLAFDGETATTTLTTSETQTTTATTMTATTSATTSETVTSTEITSDTVTSAKTTSETPSPTTTKSTIQNLRTTTETRTLTTKIAPTTSSNTPLSSTSNTKTTTKSITVTPSACALLYYQCGGINWSGPTCCKTGSHCVVQNPYYSQCIQDQNNELTPNAGVLGTEVQHAAKVVMRVSRQTPTLVDAHLFEEGKSTGILSQFGTELIHYITVESGM
ncbi:carbohydrate-binding module family 1 protein [Gonapodya prolifera JEL478]|uniref:Carbohydrate-binding module family 1 protein n=1 Tax=Gonapodya prolifera (strain JEL478) TaxID=1344416 RepID=A0A139AXH3_GONPJ|nr:carbohydrate-binding module family 1 protein [Gonapodya prolifera JEL478]|eukprot:KXS21428.1 carbohydrate-binding module family 1 protein [Gonapodya prolifera JEL478]